MVPKEIILAYERGFAARLASQVLKKPRLNAWMIFIPFIFIFYFQDLSTYKKQRKAFMENWLLSRKRMLNEAADALEGGRPPDIDRLSQAADLPEKGKQPYAGLLTVLAGHYTGLLRAEESRYEGLVRAAYQGKKGEYRYFVNQLGNAEKALNKALAPQMKKTDPNVSQTITRIETQTDRIRRQEIDLFFDSPIADR